MNLRLDVVTISPGYLEPLRHALLDKAIEQSILSVGVHNPYGWVPGVHQAIDDSPYDGGPSMVMKPDVWGLVFDRAAALKVEQSLTSAVPHLDNVRHDQKLGLAEESSYAVVEVLSLSEGDSMKPLLTVPTPVGEPFTQQMAQEFSYKEHIVFACRRYKGIDRHVIDDTVNRYRVCEVSVGDYVLIGGEVAVLMVAESVVWSIPGVLGDRKSHEEDSLSDGLLERPPCIKPHERRGLATSDVFLDSNHTLVDRWQHDQTLIRTAKHRPDLLTDVDLSARDQKVIREVIGEVIEENCWWRVFELRDPDTSLIDQLFQGHWYDSPRRNWRGAWISCLRAGPVNRTGRGMVTLIV